MKRAALSALIMVVALALFVAASVSYLVVTTDGQQHTITQQQRELDASCRFYRLIGTLAVPPSPPPSREGIELVVTSRQAYLGERCGHLSAPSAELRQWAAHYHLSPDGNSDG